MLIASDWNGKVLLVEPWDNLERLRSILALDNLTKHDYTVYKVQAEDVECE